MSSEKFFSVFFEYCFSSIIVLQKQIEKWMTQLRFRRQDYSEDILAGSSNLISGQISSKVMARDLLW